MSYDLTFEVAPELYRRAVTTSVGGVPSARRKALGNIAAMVLFPASIFAFNRALFEPSSLVAMCFAAVLGAGLVFVVWWRQHQKLVSLHQRYNETGGVQSTQLNAKGIVAARPLITSHINWGFVRELHSIDGATLIELPTARLIVPDTALPEGVDQVSFITQLEQWRAQ